MRQRQIRSNPSIDRVRSTLGRRTKARIEELVSLFKPKQPKVTKRRIQRYVRKRGKYLKLSYTEREAVIIARFGQLGLTQNPVTPALAIAKSLKIPRNTVVDLISSYLDHDGQIVVKRQGRPPENLPYAIERQILDPQRLQSWGPFSLKQRVVLCETELNYKISFYRLKKVYKSANVRYRKTKWVYRQSIELKAPLERQRQEFALVLAGVIKEGRGPIYFDEST